MKNEASLNVITANDLLSGEVVYLTASGKWSPEHGNAISFEEIAIANARLAGVHEADGSIVGAYLAGAALERDLAPSPVHFREVFRTKGPSNRALGKQTYST